MNANKSRRETKLSYWTRVVEALYNCDSIQFHVAFYLYIPYTIDELATQLSLLILFYHRKQLSKHKQLFTSLYEWSKPFNMLASWIWVNFTFFSASEYIFKHRLAFMQ